MTTLDEFDPLAPDVVADPYPWLDRLRDENPVRWVDSRGVFVVTGYDEVTAALRDPTVFSSTLGYEELPNVMSGKERSRSDALGGGGDDARMLISSDPPVHTELRRLVSRVFTPRAVNELEPRLREVCREMVQALAANVAAGKADLINDLAAPFPVVVIAELLGVPTERRLDFRRWSDALAGALDGDTDADAAAASGAELFAYMSEAVEGRRAEPGDDLISRLLLSMDDSPDSLNTVEVVLFAILLLAGGNETTANLLGNAAAAVSSRPEVAERIWSDPSQIPAFVEEVLRWDPPIQSFLRGTTSATTLGDVEIPEKALVLLSFAGANRDPRHFENPDAFDMDRTVTDHLSFGNGVHFCLGASLARREALLTFESLVEAGVRLHPGEGVERTTGAVLRGFKTFPLINETA